ncbi:MAG: ABC transporter ATP-binding protein [Clostridia bacterium]|nr:ABC transporter ATP-binding protein [Clostridia bacterium]
MIRVSSLRKKYGDITAVKDVSFDIEKGRVYGLLGPNGAGKSTVMNIMTGVLDAEGEVNVDGIDLFDDPRAAKAKIGYLPEVPPVYGELTAVEYLTFIAHAKGLRGERAESAVAEAMERTGLSEVGGRVIRNLSKGYTQRVGIAGAIIGEPEYVILDEPTVGLDPIQIREIRELIRDLADEHTVILSSHILAEVQLLCDELIVINRGRIAASGTKEEVVRALGGERRIELTVRGGVSTDDFRDIAGITSVSVDGRGTHNHFTFTVAERDVREEIALRVTKRGGVIRELYMHEPTLEDIFVRIITSEEENDGNI